MSKYTNYPPADNKNKSLIHYNNGEAYVYYMFKMIQIMFNVFNTNSDKIWLLDELVKVKTKYCMDEYKKLFYKS
jgi:hypothetical protein